MDKQNIVVTFNVFPEQKALVLEVLGSDVSLTFLNEIPATKREQALEKANVLLSWNFPREIVPQDYPHLQQVMFIQLMSAGADHMPFVDLPPRILVASNPGAYAAPIAEHVMAMTLALAKRLLLEHQKLGHHSPPAIPSLAASTARGSSSSASRLSKSSGLFSTAICASVAPYHGFQ
jgi:phosphoglycerate dehydrogenase-like enzyme